MDIGPRIQQAIFLAVTVMAIDPAWAQVAVVVSAKSPVTTLSAAQVSDIFLGKSLTYPHGERAIPLDQPEESPARKDFYSKVAGKTPALLKAYWSRLIFTGKGYPPKEAGNDDAVKKVVANNEQFIGYIERSAVDASVKVVLVTE